MVKSHQWFAIIALFTLLTIVAVYIIPENSDFVAIRYVFGFIFPVVLPGYCLVNALFVKGNKLDLIEETVLSVALSFGIAGLIGLFLGLSPIGITPISTTVSLGAIALILAAVAFTRKRSNEKSAYKAQNTQSSETQ